MIKCMKKGCQYYNQQLEEDVDVCPICGEPTEKTVAKTNSKIAFAAILISVISILIFWGWNIFVGYFLAAASIAGGFISKSKPAIVVPFLSAIVLVLLTLSFTM